jgi:hypothetical protein
MTVHGSLRQPNPLADRASHQQAYVAGVDALLVGDAHGPGLVAVITHGVGRAGLDEHALAGRAGEVNAVDQEDAAAIDDVEQLVGMVVGMERHAAVRRQYHQLSAQFLMVEKPGQYDAFRLVGLVRR